MLIYVLESIEVRVFSIENKDFYVFTVKKLVLKGWSQSVDGDVTLGLDHKILLGANSWRSEQCRAYKWVLYILVEMQLEAFRGVTRFKGIKFH